MTYFNKLSPLGKVFGFMWASCIPCLLLIGLFIRGGAFWRYLSGEKIDSLPPIGNALPLPLYGDGMIILDILLMIYLIALIFIVASSLFYFLSLVLDGNYRYRNNTVKFFVCWLIIVGIHIFTFLGPLPWSIAWND